MLGVRCPLFPSFFFSRRVIPHGEAAYFEVCLNTSNAVRVWDQQNYQFMKPKTKIIYWLACALAVNALAGCVVRDDRNHGGYGGYERDHGGEYHDWDHHDHDLDHHDWDHH